MTQTSRRQLVAAPLSDAPPDWDALAAAIAGQVILPNAADYEQRRRPAIARFAAVRPRAVVACATPADVATTIAFARAAGLPAVPRGGGHCFAGRSSTSGIVLDMRPMRAVSLADDGLATVEAGALLGEVYDALDVAGRTIAAGCGPDVGIAGLTLGGGLGILGRLHGLTSDQLIGAEVVLADGRIVACDHDQEPDLFWALRGAGGCHFGVVTSLRLTTIPAPAATSFLLTWPVAQAVTAIAAWQEWAPDAPEALAASLLVIAARDPKLPAAVSLFGAMVGPAAETAAQLETFIARLGAAPATRSLTHLPYRATKRYLASHGPGEAAAVPGEAAPAFHPSCKSEFFRQPLPTAAIAALVAHLSRDRAAGQTRVLDFSPWGGAYNRVPVAATAFAQRDERFLLKHEVTLDATAPPAARAAAARWLTRSWEIVQPWGTGGAYPNFPDPELSDWAGAYHGANLERLVAVKRRYDPEGFFHFHQSLPLHLPQPIGVAR